MVNIKTHANEYKDGLKADEILVNGYSRYGIGGVGKGQTGRKVYGGPLVEGPWHYVYGLATTIAADPETGTYGEMKRARAAGLAHDVKPGDIIKIDGIKYLIEKSFNGNLQLVNAR